MIDQKIRLDDATNPKRYNRLSENAQYWTNRWSDQMNYRYWKDRSAAEKTNEGVQARQFFYEGTLAYKTSDFEKAVQISGDYEPVFYPDVDDWAGALVFASPHSSEGWKGLLANLDQYNFRE